jgi:GNAT superfamily N-acetyltransferase
MKPGLSGLAFTQLTPSAHGSRGNEGILRGATVEDLPAINTVVTSAVRTWALPERVLRLALTSLLYRESDFTHMAAVVAEDRTEAVAAATWETAASVDTPGGGAALLIHGIYVVPERQRAGLGRRLVEHADKMAGLLMLDGLAVKVWRDSEAFFSALGFVPFGDIDNDALYPRRMWRPLC